MAHNKTLAAQLCNEFRTFFPDNAVEYFVSYYDYYQPEAYVPSQGPLHREGLGDQRGDRPPAPRRDGRAVRAPRRDHRRLRVARSSASARPRPTTTTCRSCARGDDDRPRRAAAQARLDPVHPQRHRARPRHVPRARRGARDLPRLRRDRPTARRSSATRSSACSTSTRSPASCSRTTSSTSRSGRPRTTTSRRARSRRRSRRSARELNERCAELEAEGKLLESHRLRQRTQYDMEMLREMGFCNGIENYSRILDGRAPGERPYCLIDYFPDDFVCFLDESHQTVPQIGGMYEGDRSRKQTLVDYGFRLPSALDNRPQTFDEFLSITPQLVFVSATPGEFERAHSVADRRADRPADRHRRPAGRGARDAQPDRRPHERGARARRARRARRWSRR